MAKKKIDVTEEVSVMQEYQEVENVAKEEEMIVDKNSEETCKQSVEEVIEEEKTYNVMVAMSITDRILDTKEEFGKCRVVVDELKIVTRSPLSRLGTETTIKIGDTFYFDKIHTTQQNLQYVSWRAENGKRSYALFKNLDTGISPVVKIEA